jgi:hypothetical protein
MTDIALGATIDIKFNTADPATGAPITLAGTPVVAAYIDNSTTEITAGITLTVDFDSRTGLHNVRVVATSGNGYTTGTSVALVLTAGTVSGTSVVGVKVGEFTIGRDASLALQPTVAGRTLDVSTAGNAGIDLDNVVITNASGAFGIQASGTLSGTHTTTTADLGTNAPSTDITGMTLTVPSKNFSRLVSSYNTSTGVATFDATAVTLANADQYYLFGTAPSSAGGGGGGLDAAGVRAAVGLASANLDTQLSGISGKLPAALVGGRIDASVGAMANNVMTASATAADYVSEIGGGGSSASAVVAALYAQAATDPLDVNVVGWNGAAVDPLQDAAEIADTLLSVNNIDYLVTGTVGANIAASGLDAAGIRAAVGLTAPDLGTRLTLIASYIDTEVTTILGVVNSIYTVVDTEVAGIKLKTDQMVFTKAGELDVNLQSINNTTITGNGSPGTEFGV